jgi:predicted metalloprotease with PDZ domain
MSHELWCAEGFTQYYGELLLTRAGLNDQKSHLGFLSGLVNAKLNSQGGKFYSPVDASNHAVFVDAAVSIDRNNYSNMFTSYYTYGAAIALALDLELQTRYHLTLDAFMQAMWKRFGKTEIPYTIPTMIETLGSITDTKFAQQFFSQYITGHAPIDYAGLFSKAGYNLVNTSAGKASMGANLQFADGGKVTISNNTVKGTAAYEAGLDINDEMMQLDNIQIKSAADLNNYLQQKKPGDKIVITYKHRNTVNQTTLTLHEQVALSLQPIEEKGNTVTAEMREIRKTWFNSKVTQ